MQKFYLVCFFNALWYLKKWYLLNRQLLSFHPFWCDWANTPTVFLFWFLIRKIGFIWWFLYCFIIIILDCVIGEEKDPKVHLREIKSTLTRRLLLLSLQCGPNGAQGKRRRTLLQMQCLLHVCVSAVMYVSVCVWRQWDVNRKEQREEQREEHTLSDCVFLYKSDSSSLVESLLEVQ